ncbi:hypothetical protein ABK040_004445 [Willaertia magna]
MIKSIFGSKCNFFQKSTGKVGLRNVGVTSFRSIHNNQQQQQEQSTQDTPNYNPQQEIEQTKKDMSGKSDPPEKSGTSNHTAKTGRDLNDTSKNETSIDED